jgi:uncharacterized protein YegP (UPF0339 family)
MAGYFQLKPAANNQWMFNLKAGNHEVILSSESYSSKQAAESGIQSVRTAAADNNAFLRKTASSGSAYFTLTSTANGNGQGRLIPCTLLHNCG